MCKSELYDTVLGIVAKETEISVAEIEGGGKSREVVDARYLAIQMLSERGFYPTEIARKMNLTPQCVRCILRCFGDRRKQNGKIFEINWKRISNSLETD